jgi:hypothetical protein
MENNQNENNPLYVKMSKLRIDIIFYILLLILFSFLIVGYRLAFCHNYIGYEGYLKQNYGKPFVTRALVIWIALFLQKFLNIAPNNIFILLELFAFILSGWVFSIYINIFLKNITISRILSFTIYFIIPFEFILPMYKPLWYPYDAFALLFCLCGLILIHNGNFRWYYILFVIASFNRETTCFLTIIMLIVCWNQMPAKLLGLHLFAQLSIWIVIKMFLAYLFINQPGIIFQHQYFSNILFLTNMFYEQHFPYYLEVLFRPVYFLGNFGFIYLFVIIFWHKLDNIFLRRSVFVMIPFYISMLYVANIYEYRIFGEMIPIILMPSLYILVKLLGEVKFDIVSQHNI